MSTQKISARCLDLAEPRGSARFPKAKELGLSADVKLAPGAIDKLLAYPWPGNVRQLANVVERALILDRGSPLNFDPLLLDDLDREAPHNAPLSPEATRLDDVIARHIERVLEQTAGRINGPGGAAELLGVHPSTLRSRMQKLGVAYGRKTRGH